MTAALKVPLVPPWLAGLRIRAVLMLLLLLPLLLLGITSGLPPALDLAGAADRGVSRNDTP